MQPAAVNRDFMLLILPRVEKYHFLSLIETVGFQAIASILFVIHDRKYYNG